MQITRESFLYVMENKTYRISRGKRGAGGFTAQHFRIQVKTIHPFQYRIAEIRTTPQDTCRERAKQYPFQRFH